MRTLFIFVLMQLVITMAFSQEQRALVIGIDSYAPPRGALIPASAARLDWPSLAGCKNDADLIRGIIISRFGFTENNVQEINNSEATRNNILKAMEGLLAASNKDDIAFIYYAGHGSQVKNSLSAETDKKDESIVPVDTWKEGVFDIRDKELARLFDRFVDKGIKLTCIFDCCHSGSIARGLYPVKNRYMPEANYDAKDASAPLAPETRKHSAYLIISAAQDNEPAQEQKINDSIVHGAFTVALVNALDQQSVKASVQNLFSAIRALLKSNGKSQEPVLAGDPDRFNQTLFGMDQAKLTDKNLIPVLEVKGNTVILQAGIAAGLNIGNELTSVNGNSKIKISNLISISRSEAVIMPGNTDPVKPGELFAVSNWVASKSPLLNIYLPDGNYSYSELMKLAAVDAQLKRSAQVKWMNQFGKSEPGISINAVNNKFICIDYAKGISGTQELKEFSAANIIGLAKGKNLFVNLPPDQELVKVLQNRFAESNMQLVRDPASAQYVLYGTINESGKPAYGFLKADMAIRDSLASLPIYTQYHILNADVQEAYHALADSLFETALKLSKIRGWLTLSAPKGAGFFPYHLLMRNKQNNDPVDSAGVKTGTNIALYLEADNDYLARNIPPKYIYVFTVDIDGKMQLLYPAASDGNSQNKFPFYTDGMPVRQFIIQDDMQAAEPVGTDNYFLIASKEPITSYNRIFNQDGVKGTARGGEDNNPLSALLNMGNRSGARGIINATPATWNLLRLAVTTTH